MKLTLIAWVCFACISLTAYSQDTIPKRIANTIMLESSQVPAIDGLLDEDIWNTGNWESDFKQDFPNSGEAPGQESAFKILCDEKYIYVAFKCFDTEPEKIEQRLSRRDGFEGDRISIAFDSGFASLASFQRAFKRETGKTPSTWRNQF